MCESFNLTSIFEKNLKRQAPPVHTTMEKFENAAFSTVRLTVRTDPSKNRNFSKTYFANGRNLKALAGVLVWTGKKLKTELFKHADIKILM